MIKFTIPTLFTLIVICSGFAQTPPIHISEGISTLFDGHVNQTAGLVPGHVIRVEKPGNWVYMNAAGLSAVNPAMTTQADMKFKVASITKMFTTVAIFKLIQNGQLNFNAPIGTYLPLSVVQGFENYQQIKIKNLLNHTSGITEPQSDFQGRLNYWIYMKRFDDIPLDSLWLWSYSSPNGVGNYNYSNANFYLLAEIIKSVSGDTYQDYVTNNIITPLGLTNTDFHTIPTGNFMRGYLRGTFYETGSVPDGLVSDSLYDFTEASNSWGYGAADIWSNTSDLIQFHKALFSGQLIHAEWLDTMKAVVTNTGDMGSYGHGMIQFKSYNGGPIYSYGHTGTAFGYGAMLCYIPDLDVYMCSAGNYMKIGQEFLQRDIYNFLASQITNIDAINFNELFHLYPNPASNQLNINIPFQDIHVTIFDIAGRLMMEAYNKSALDISPLPPGLYILTIEDKQSLRTVTRNFVCK